MKINPNTSMVDFLEHYMERLLKLRKKLIVH